MAKRCSLPEAFNSFTDWIGYTPQVSGSEVTVLPFLFSFYFSHHPMTTAMQCREMLPAKDWVLRGARYQAASTKDEIHSVSHSQGSSHQTQDPQHMVETTS